MNLHPHVGEYQAVLRNPAAAFTDSRLKTAQFAFDSWGLPAVIAGSSAVVFHAAIGGKGYALRCFTRRGASSPERYAALDSFVAHHPGLSKHVSHVTWHDDAVRVKGSTWPVLQMEWIEGQQLNEYVGYLADDSNTDALGQLASRWRKLVGDLQRARFAHGNLSHGDVLIDRQGSLRLVDYDSVWIPPLQGYPAPPETGHPNYQPRGLSAQVRWGPWMDTFSALVIYLALTALAKDPGLWLPLNDGDNLLFERKDFSPPFETGVWRHLAKVGDPQVDELARLLQECCAPGWVAAKSLEETLGRQLPQRTSREWDTAARSEEYAGSRSGDTAVVAPSSPAAPGGIFISYRRDDTAYPCGWLYDKLAQHFGQDQVFKDIDSIELGDDFVEVITAAVGKCDVLLALIGRRWLATSNEDGRPRLDDPNDFVRLEIEAAIARNVRIIPVLVEGVRMPRADELPPSLVRLTRRHALELSPSHFDAGIERLLRVLDKTLANVQAPPE